MAQNDLNTPKLMVANFWKSNNLFLQLNVVTMLQNIVLNKKVLV